MKLYSWAGGLIVAGVMLWSAESLRTARYDDWLAEEADPQAHIWTPKHTLDALGDWNIRTATDLGGWTIRTGKWALDVLGVRARTALELNWKYVTWNPPENYRPYNGETVGYGRATADSLEAFPGCEGPGCGALQQYRPNGVRVCRVANLNNSGAGSFVACAAVVEADSNVANKPLDVTVFDTAGPIKWIPTCSNNACNLWRGWYVMGQSGPGPVVFHTFAIDPRKGSEDVVWRSIAHRGRAGSGSYSFRMKGFRGICDHCSFSHGAQRSVQSAAVGSDQPPWDSTEVSRYHTWSNIFLSYKGTQRDRTANISESPTLFMFSSSPRPAPLISNIAMLKSVIYSWTAYRFPGSNADSVWIHNNLIYAYGVGTHWSKADDGAVTDYTFNEYRAGAGVTGNRLASGYWPLTTDTTNACTWTSNDTTPAICDNSVHYDRNWIPHIMSDRADTAMSQDSIWEGSERYITQDHHPTSSKEDTFPPSLSRQRTTALPYTLPFGFDTLAITHANMDVILDSAGSGWKIDSLGAIYMAPDTVDRRARNAVLDTAQYLEPGDVNRDSFLVDFFPDFSLDVDPKCRDEEAGGVGDGMCDAWEELVADTSLVANAIQASGYSAIELAYAGGITNIDTVFGEAPPAGDETYGTDPPRFVHFDTLYGPDTVFSNPDPATGEPQDTFIQPARPSTDTLPWGTQSAVWWHLDDSLHAIILTVEDLSPAAVRDSEWVDSTLTANTTLCNTRGICAPADLRDVPIPGVP